jgi:RTX calcium-binding nonapeptide repeat (4 copies)
MRGFFGACLAAVVLAALCAGPAGAATISFDGEVFRYRAAPTDHGVSMLVWGAPDEPRGFAALVQVPITDAPGCFVRQATEPSPGLPSGQLSVRCPFDAGGPLVPTRYRLVLADESDFASFHRVHWPSGVTYAGAGDDKISGGDEVWGGPGDDTIEGFSVFGGSGDDSLARMRLFGNRQFAYDSVLRGGDGNDTFSGLAWQYGGSDDDHLKGYRMERAQMLVGGAGQDVVELLGNEGRGRYPPENVVRIRDGGEDIVRCDNPVFDYVIYLDRVDVLGKNCTGARLRYRGRPKGASLIPYLGGVTTS